MQKNGLKPTSSAGNCCPMYPVPLGRAACGRHVWNTTVPSSSTCMKTTEIPLQGVQALWWFPCRAQCWGSLGWCSSEMLCSSVNVSVFHTRAAVPGWISFSLLAEVLLAPFSKGAMANSWKSSFISLFCQCNALCQRENNLYAYLPACNL